MIKIGDETAGLVAAWKRFAEGNADGADFRLILADLLEACHLGQTLSFASFLAEQKTLTDYPLYAALIAAKQEVGKRIVKLLNYGDEEVAEAIRRARGR